MPQIAGLTLVKIDGVYELDATNVSWSVDKAVQQHVTGAGIKSAEGVEMPSGTIDEVISLDGSTNWRTKSNFRIDIYDKETRSKIIHSQSGCHWNKADGSSDNTGPNTKQKISWKGELVNALTPAG